MEKWKFLLQKEGDRSWLPLDSPDVEILEGRYRIVARSSQVNSLIEIRISHLTLGEDPPKRRIQKRTGQTNKEGLMVVIPYTWLKPGLWELCCSSTDLMSDLLGDSWQYAVKLQVTAQEVEAEEWEPDWSPAAIAAEEVSTTAESSGAIEESLASAKPSGIAELSEASDQPSLLPAVAFADRPKADSGSAAAADSLEERLETVESPSSTVPVTESETNPITSNDPIPLSPEVSEILGASMDRLFQIAEQMSNQLVDEVLRDFDLMSPIEVLSQLETVSSDHELVDQATGYTFVEQSERHESSQSHDSSPADSGEVFTTSSSVSSQENALGYALSQETTLSLTLEQESFISRRGEELTLLGQVEVKSLPALDFSTHQHSVQSTPLSDSETPDVWALDENSLNLTGAIAQELQLYLRDPQSLQVLVSDRRFLPDYPPPYPFSFSFFLPEYATTHLVLGEVLLCGTLPNKPGSMVTLVTQSFTVTTDPNDLLDELAKLNGALEETLANHPEEEKDRIDLPFEISNQVEKENELSLTLSFLEPEPDETPSTDKFQFATLAGQPLPPQIYKPDPNQLRNKPIELPGFALPFKKAVPDLDGLTEQTSDSLQSNQSSSLLGQSDQSERIIKSEQIDESPFTLEQQSNNGDSEQHELVVFSEPVEAIDAPKQVERELSDATTNPELENQAVEQTTSGLDDSDSQTHPNLLDSSDRLDEATDEAGEASEIDLPSPVNMGFQALNLQDRFLTRLNSLANDTELSAWLRSQLKPETDSTSPLTDPSSEAEVETPAKEIEAARMARETVVNDKEVVVNDDELANFRVRRRNGSNRSKMETLQTSQDTELNVLILPKDEPIPPPRLEVTNGELVSGELVNIRVKLPNLIPRVYVKLWVTDRQTRSLLDGPRWMLDFLPNGLGDMEAFTQITIPFGSLDVRFEAITIEMHTQRESHKVSVEREVVPPNLPVMSLEDFDA